MTAGRKIGLEPVPVIDTPLDGNLADDITADNDPADGTTAGVNGMPS